MNFAKVVAINYQLVKREKDLDYEISLFAQRLSLKGINQLFVNLLLAPFISVLTLLMGKQDTMILLFKRN